MTEKELRDDILVKLLDYKDHSIIRVNEFCANKGILFSSPQQRKKIFKYLNDNGYIDIKFAINGYDCFSITSKGIDYAKDLLASKDITSINLNDYYHQQRNKKKDITSPSYTTKENNKQIIDNNVPACFNVEYLAKCYVKLIDRACEHGNSNVCLFGIFAPWGRGKSYFFKKIKEYIYNREHKIHINLEGIKLDNQTTHHREPIHYDIVEFNAWKYQETPAIWAYLFETLYNSKSWWFKFLYTIKRNLISITCDLFICFIPIVLTALATLLIKKETNSDYTSIGVGIVSALSSIGLILNYISKHYNSAISLIKKYTKGISFANELGVQAEIEKEITSLLKFWISDKEAIKKKVILYVDDIDRCSETKMTSIIDSLRTVLENEEIRKRLIIICSIDPEKIIKGIEYKYQTLYDEKERRSIAIEQMDKIFLTGIALAPLNNEQLFEFAAKLAEVEDNRNSNSNNLTASKKSLDDIIRESIMEETRRDLLYVKLDDEQIYLELKNFIKDYTKQLTPRKIRIIYYRIVLANNIICNKKDSMITKTLINNIFNLSVGNKIEKSDKDDELTDILNMVVPYRYNEEDEVTSKVTQG